MNVFQKAAAKAKSGFYTFAAVGTAAMMTGPAFAGELATAVTGALDSTEMTLIGVGVLTLTGVVVLIKKSQRAAGG